MKSGNLNFLEPSGPLQACNGTDLPLPDFRIVIALRTVQIDANETGTQINESSILLIITHVYFRYCDV